MWKDLGLTPMYVICVLFYILINFKNMFDYDEW